ncbi:hypothetical protein B9Z55_026774 [Caenorhabditis nigoni]|uniref:Uncharacterized protein n=1 Tax=Caenorhabditis nigoni TaxID=1611254 RepID=A0A2G5SHQ7_9PELO|nr:hypothetical protein B9Z55_026774 [Caenorhabditis nigoni]
MKIFLLFSLAFLVYAEVPDCPNGYLKFDHTKTRVVFPSDGNLQIFPDNYVCQLQITVPLGYFATLTIDVESANPGNSAPVKVIDQTNQAEEQLFDRKSQFVTSNDEHFLTVLFLGDPTATVINFVANLYELTQQFTEIQALVYPKDWTGELSMDASKGKSLVQTWAQAYQREPAIIQGVLNINGNGSLAVYANLSLPILVNPIATYDASNTGNQLPQQVYGPASSYLLTGGKSKITLSNDKNKLEQTKNFGRTGYFASQNFGTPDRIQDFEFGLTGVANSTTRTIFHLDFITMYFKGDEDYLTIAVFEDGAQVTERN